MKAARQLARHGVPLIQLDVTDVADVVIQTNFLAASMAQHIFWNRIWRIGFELLGFTTWSLAGFGVHG